jgi:hypothetical protein
MSIRSSTGCAGHTSLIAVTRALNRLNPCLLKDHSWQQQHKRSIGIGELRISSDLIFHACGIVIAVD